MVRLLLLTMQHLRTNYRNKSDNFNIPNLTFLEPIKEFKVWFGNALKCKDILEPNAMALATSTINGIPNVRFVLLKEANENGFQFYTNCLSKKGMELAANPKASAVLYWQPLHQQIRINGTVSILPSKVTDAYFQSRPKESRISAIVSQVQSSVVRNREVMQNNFDQLTEKYSGDCFVPRPDYWLGYNINPTSIEFWQGQTNRLHDRILFRLAEKDEILDENVSTRGEDNWIIERLSP